MRKTAAATLVCIWLLVGFPTLRAAEPALPAEAAKAIQAGNWEQVVTLLTPLARDEKNESASYWLGNACFMLGKMPEAQAALTNALKANPRCRPAALMLAQCTAELCTGGRARMTPLEPALAAFPFDAEIAHWAGRAWMNKYFFSQEYKRDGKELEETGREYLDAALSEFERAGLLRPDYADNERWLAFALLRTDRCQEAVEHAKNAIRLEPVGWEVYATLSSALTRMGRDVEAAEAYETAIAACPAMRNQIDFERGRALLAAGHFNEAVQALKGVLEADKGYPFARYWLARAAIAAKDYALAMWAIKESHMLDAELIDDYYLAGRCAYGLKRYDMAEQLFARSISQAEEAGGRPSPDWIHYMGRTQWALGKKADAFKSLELACERSPDNVPYAEWLFRAYVADNELYKAVMVCNQLAQHGQPDAAAEWLQAMLKKWPQPRFEDIQAKKYPHAQPAREVLGHTYYKQERFFSAVYWFGEAKCAAGKFVRTRAGWASLHAGQPDAAEKVFRNYLAADEVFLLNKASVVRHKQTETDKDYGRLGLGTVLARQGKWDESRKAFEAITKEDWDHMKKTGMLWADMALKKPGARQLADPYTLLGMMDGGQYGQNNGIGVLAVLPGSLLDGQTPAILPDDRVACIGEMHLGSAEQLKALRASQIPTQPVQALIRRGEYEFEVTLDFPSALKKLGASTEAKPR